MAQNTGYYQQQQQQQYYPPSQLQNIYQQLGKPQPQPHLQRHPTYQQPPAQGYPFSQQQYLPPTSFPLAQAPYAPPQTPYQLSQTPQVLPHPQVQAQFQAQAAPQTSVQAPVRRPLPQPSPSANTNRRPLPTPSAASTIPKSTSSSASTAVPPPKKFTPLWRRTIPDYPAPAWGYAAGMVSEPHPKPKVSLQPAQRRQRQAHIRTPAGYPETKDDDDSEEETDSDEEEEEEEHRVPRYSHAQSTSQSQFGGQQGQARRGGLICGGCNGSIMGRIVSAMGSRWHPACFRCTVCNELLEHVSSYEHEGRAYCHLDYHENFAPKCYSCKTAIIEERFISLDDPALGKRAYHTQHFFCAECGDPFLSPSVSSPNSKGEVALSGDGEFEGFTVYKGYPYCEACHVRLRLPKCKRCKRSIRDRDVAVEALGGKWCWRCFVCANCDKPFENPSFFQRDDKPFCERCFSIMLRNEV